MKKILLIISLSLALFGANKIKTGSSLSELKSFKFLTPQDRKMKIPKSTRLIIIAFEKDTGRLVNDYLNAKTPHFLPKKRAIYIADIHEMPTIITNMFALPKLRKYKHLIYLHYDDDFQEIIPNKEEQVTLLHVKDGVITNVSFIKTKQELQAVVEK